MSTPPIQYCHRFGSAEFDEARFELRVAGLPVEVERRALEVLLYLLRHVGEVVTKDELLREVWAGRPTVDKVLPNAINKLRRALGEANANHIHTQARVGYRLEGPVSRTAVGHRFVSELALAAGHAVPGRGNFLLSRPLGRTLGSEVWLAEHQKTHALRVYKFALADDRLRALKREATLLRLLQDSVDQADHIVDVIDWNFEHPPFFLECAYGGTPLDQWAGESLERLDRAARIRLFLQIADAVAAAHAVGVLHKDLKPANILVAGETDLPHVRLTDFGSGHVFDLERLQQLGITRLGMTVTDNVARDSGSATPLYLAPEVFAGQTPTVRSDLYALGIILYQLLSDRFGQPMAPGWERDVDDPLLREDIELATDVRPERRHASVADFASRLRALDTRRDESARMQDEAAAHQRDREALARSRARRPFLLASIALLVLTLLSSLALQLRAERARADADAALQRVSAVLRFLDQDLIAQANPMRSPKGPDTSVLDALRNARDRIGNRFANDPQTEATVRNGLAEAFDSLDQWADAEAEAARAIDLLTSQAEPGSEELLRATATHTRVLARLGRDDDAASSMAALEQLSAQSDSALTRYLLAATRAALALGHSDFPLAVTQLREALSAIQRNDVVAPTRRDSLRLDLISALTMSGDEQGAREEAQSLIATAQDQGGVGELTAALARLAMARAMGEDHDAAERLLLEAEPVIVAHLGAHHSRHLQLLGELLGVAFRRGDWNKAARYAEAAHRQVREKFGDQHVLTQVTLANWGRTLFEAGKPQEAVDRVRQAYQALQTLAGQQAPQTQDAAFLLATIELELGDQEAAGRLIEHLDPAVLESARATGVWAAGIDALRGQWLAQRGDRAAARPLLEHAVAALSDEEDLDAPSRLYVDTLAALHHLDTTNGAH